MNLTDILLFLILVTIVTYTFMPWKGIDKGSGLKLYGQWFIWAIIVGGIPIPDLIEMGWSSQKKMDEIVQRTRDGGAEIVALLKTGSAYYAPAASAINMADSYLKDQKRVIPCASYLTGQYGYSDIYVGVPTVIGNKGVEKIIEINLDEIEKINFSKSVESVQKLIQDCKKIDMDLN